MAHSGTYASSIVGLSVLIAILASYTSLDLAARMRASSGFPRRMWLLGGAFVMGGGIWAMHFVGMLAFSLGDIGVSYDPLLTALSFVVPVCVTAAALAALGQDRRPTLRFVLGGIVMGVGIASMHYLGMAAMRMPAAISYDPAWVAASLVIAIGASIAALWLAVRHNGVRERILAAVVLGFAVSGMHYAAMAGASFTPLPEAAATGHRSLEQGVLAMLVAGAAVAILVVALAAAKLDRSLAQRAARDAGALRESEERFRLLVQSVTDYAIFLLDPTGVVRNWNAGAERIKGYAANEIIGRHFSTFYTPEDRTSRLPDKALATARDTGRFAQEGWRMRKDGSRFWASVVIEPVRGDDGELVGFAKVTRDMTERKQSQEALEAAREALFQARKMEAIGQLTGGVSHEFNNLLMAILGSLEIARKRVDDDPARARRFIDNATLAAQRGATLTQRMLAFARRQHLEPVTVSLEEVVRGMSDLLKHSLGSSHRLEIAFPPDLPTVTVDKHQLELALLNLVLNARDAMPRGGRIDISGRLGERGSDLQGLACLAVSDTGIGMDADTLARAREPFFTTKGTGKGTGLGLAMVSGLAEQSRGRLVLKSQVGEGTTAEIWLPVAGRDAAPTDAPAEAPAAPRPSGRPLDILVIDDDPLVLENTLAMLEDLGHRVLEASSGPEALAILPTAGDLDLVITDQVMPGMTGIELARNIERLRPGLPVVVASGFSETPEALRYPRLNKPYDQAALARVLEQVTGGRGRTRV